MAAKSINDIYLFYFNRLLIQTIDININGYSITNMKENTNERN